ncbi:haloacid dehalogenase [Loigolactobacillus backii]|uniref:HAD-IA family hydrolase n=1 Tax=Loigolactobacillus backii TaxID=375175 RepID=UPI000C1CA1D8|nr:HAD-IA family hydrolase [Loigolactobacillus backii]PIO83526.1 haloacid dehalogenase [Loigolactobacillus backii]
MLDSVIWDFDGTLYDTYPIILKSLQKTLQEFNIQVEDGKLYRLIKVRSVHYAIQHFSELKGLSNEQVKARYHEIEEDRQLEPKPLKGALETCQAVIDKGGRNFLLTHRDRGAIRFLEHDGLAELFTDFVTSDQHFKRKPDPESLIYLISRYQLKAANTIMVGDRPLDVEAGLNAGVKACFYDIDAFHGVSNATITIDQLTDLIPYIG